ncbi:MAG: DUF5675 family protein [Candidatus Thorarchaeota archaeon]
MIKARLKRANFTDKQVTGILEILKNNQLVYKCCTLELPWLNNQPKISCIPEGIYIVQKRYTKKFGNHFHIIDVPGRSYILIHPGNFNNQTKGCILIGNRLLDINNDGYRDVLNSKQTITELNEILPKEFEIKIIN